jgi:hypothetical protein
LPAELADLAAGSVRQHAYRAAARIRQDYPVSGRTKSRGGNRKRIEGVRLAQGVRLTEEFGPYGASAIVRSTAKHAHLWEWGTGPRQHANGRHVGRMSPSTYGAPVFVPVVVDERERMLRAFIDQLRHAGIELEVTVS